MNKISSLRTLPPAGPPLPLSSLFKAFISSLGASKTEEKLHVQLKQYFNSEYAALTDSGRSGLSLALVALHKLYSSKEQEARNEVLIPAYVSYSVPSAVVHAGFKVRLYDIDPLTLTPDYESMRNAVSDKTVAIVICHQFGLPFDGAQAKEIAQEFGTYLLDDAAQAMGGTVKGKYAGCMGDIGLFSLSRGKPLTSVEGGILLTNSQAIASSLKISKEELYKGADKGKISKLLHDIPTMIKAVALYLLRRPILYSIPASLPFLNIGASIFEPDFPDGEMSPYRMGLTLAGIPLLSDANRKRNQWAEKYNNFVNNHEGLLSIPAQNESKTVYLRYPLISAQGKEKYIQKIMSHDNGNTAKKLGISRGFPLALYAVETLKPHLVEINGNPQELYKGATYLAENLITLPTHDQVTENDFATITNFFTQI